MNTILAKYRKTGLLTHVASYGGTYLDLPEEADYQSCVHFVMRAQRAFEQLPAHARKRFNNDPGNFLAFAENPANRDEMVKMGLMLPPPAPQPSPEGSPSVDSAETPPAGSAGS